MGRKSDHELDQWLSLSQAFGYGLVGVWAFCTTPSIGGWSLGNVRLVVSAMLFTFAASWFEAFRRYRIAARKVRGPTD